MATVLSTTSPIPGRFRHLDVLMVALADALEPDLEDLLWPAVSVFQRASTGSSDNELAQQRSQRKARKPLCLQLGRQFDNHCAHEHRRNDGDHQALSLDRGEWAAKIRERTRRAHGERPVGANFRRNATNGQLRRCLLKAQGHLAGASPREWRADDQLLGTLAFARGIIRTRSRSRTARRAMCLPRSHDAQSL
jgi:hypothetical protein